MDDLISRSKLIDRLKRRIRTPRSTMEIIRDIIPLVEIQPPVEAVPVVHCKDCEHWGTGVAGETEHVKCCEYGKYMVGENGYCCYADMRKKVQE